MARPKSPEKRTAILLAAVQEISETGLSASTANIAKRAGIAAGTLFTYFANKEELLNELYRELKQEVYARINADFPDKASLEMRTRHIWMTSLNWSLQFPEKRKVSMQLSVSDVISSETRAKAAAGRNTVNITLGELNNRNALNGLPSGFAAAIMASMQEATMDFLAKHPKQRKEIIERAFQIFWRAVR